MRSWQGGDEDAFRDLYERFSPALRRNIQSSPYWRVLTRRCQIDDVVHGIWARVIHSADRNYESAGCGGFEAWISRIGEFHMIDLLRAQSAARRGGGLDPDPLDTRVLNGVFSRAPETPTSHARASEYREIVREVCNPREYLAWSLVVIHGFTAEEAGQAMGEEGGSGSAIRGLAKRGREKILKRLYGGEHGS